MIDNGSGISAAQIPLALSRHATSKLEAFEDLDNLTTLGFRGEALPSIAAVSHLTIRSREAESEAGVEAVVSYGADPLIQHVATSPGTFVAVEGLFGNVPARRKFLRKPATETATIVRTVEAYALANPAVSFQMEVDGRKVFTTQGNGDDLAAVISVLGVDSGNGAIALTQPDESALVPGVTVSGWICSPSIHRATRQSIIFFVNGRWIQNRTLTYALEEAFHTLLMVGRHPVAMIRIGIDPGQVDVNVHPTKAEVKFVDERSVARAVARTVHATLASMPQPGIPRIAFDGGAVSRYPAMTLSQSLPVTPWIASQPQSASTLDQGPTQIIKREMPVLRVLGQVGATYIIAEGPEGLYMIDQHAAHERILYERFQTKLLGDQIERQPMLDPVVVERER